MRDRNARTLVDAWPKVLLAAVALASAAARTHGQPPTATGHAETVTFHLVDAEVITTSDWTVIEIGGPDGVLSGRIVSDAPGEAKCSGGRLEVHQSLKNAKAGKEVHCKARLAIAAVALGGPVTVVIEKGALGDTTVRLTPHETSGSTLPAETVKNTGTVPGNTDRNRREYAVDLSEFRASPPRRAELSRPGVPKMVWAFYYPWYSIHSWESPELKDRPTARYSSDDPAAMRRHIDQAKAAGIDGFICSWWGPGDRTDKAFAKILEAAKEKDFKVSIYFETLNEKGGRPEKQVLEWLRSFVKTYGSSPSLMHVNNKPLVVLWASGSERRETWRRVFDTLHKEGLDAWYIGMGYDPSLLDLFGGLHEYGVFNIPDLATQERDMGRAVRCFSLLDDNPSPPRLWCATVQPGYDERPIPGRRGLFKDRDAGAFYRSTWDAALASDPDWVFVSTWNEWWEHTYIEPGEKEGDLYLRITGEYSDRWKKAP